MNKYPENFEVAFNLYNIIQERFCDRFVGEIWKTLQGKICGKIDSKEFWIKPIVCKESNGKICALIASARYEKERDVLNEIVPILSQLMGNVTPICSYDYVYCEDEARMDIDRYPTIEWDIIDPDRRIIDIINGTYLEELCSIENIQLLNGKNISDYLEKGPVLEHTRKVMEI